jgi:hypothetical protein
VNIFDTVNEEDSMNRPQKGSSQGIAFPFQDAFRYFLINPMTNWQRFFNPQFYINYNAGDVDVENNVLREVGSYGMQLGRIIDVLDVLVARLPKDELTSRERYVVDRFQALSEKVTAAVAAVQGPKEEDVTLADVDRLISGLQSLARSDPAAHRLLVDRLQKAIGSNDHE